MGVSIYYSASRDRPLSKAEHDAVQWQVDRFPLDTLIRECGIPEPEFTGEGFCVYSPPLEPGVVFEGSTKLPGNSEEAMWIAIQHWCKLLTELRGVLQDADWHVHVDDHDIVWNEKLQIYDPAS